MSLMGKIHDYHCYRIRYHFLPIDFSSLLKLQTDQTFCLNSQMFFVRKLHANPRCLPDQTPKAQSNQIKIYVTSSLNPPKKVFLWNTCTNCRFFNDRFHFRLRRSSLKSLTVMFFLCHLLLGHYPSFSWF